MSTWNIISMDTDSKMSPATFCKIFPFHILFDTNMTILQTGSTIARIIPSTLSGTCKITDILLPVCFTSTLHFSFINFNLQFFLCFFLTGETSLGINIRKHPLSHQHGLRPQDSIRRHEGGRWTWIFVSEIEGSLLFSLLPFSYWLI